MEQQLVSINSAQQALVESGWNYEIEMEAIQPESNPLMIPRIVISHDDRGQHKMYLDYGSNYLSNGSEEVPVKGNTITGVIFTHQKIRSMWSQDEAHPICSSIDDVPVTSKPVSEICSTCNESVIGSGNCKVKQRLFMLTEVDGKVIPITISLPPASLKHFNRHLNKMKRSQLPLVIANTTFSLIDIKRNNYRYAEIDVNMDGIASKEILILARQAREEFEKLTKQISETDFSDAGDKYKT